MFIKKAFLSLFILLISLSMMVSAQEEVAELELPLSVWTTGQINPADTSVFYSVLMTSGAEAISDVTVTAQLPEGATFVQDFWKPEAATFVGEENGVLTWTIDAVDADIVAGPFTFVVSFEDSESEDFAPPASFKATVLSSVGEVENEVLDTTLVTFADTGSLEITPEGMIDLSAVEETGIWVYTPQGAVSEAVTINFQRNAISADAELPETAEETWWCGFVSLSADADVTFGQSMLLVIPLLRASTPGTVMPVFAQSEGGEWELISAEDSVGSVYGEDAFSGAAFAKVAPSGIEAYIVLNQVQLGSTPLNLAVGINTNVRAFSVQPIAPTSVFNSVSLPPPPAGHDTAPWF